MSRYRFNSWTSDPRRRKRSLFEAQSDGQVNLPITSMADIFTIVLVFLLKNISASANGFAAPVEENLPMSVAHEAPAESVRIELSLGSVLVNGRRIASIDQIKQDSGLKLLKDSLDSEHKLKNSTELVLVADKGTPYWAVEGSMEVASTAGFEGFKLMVVEEK